MRKSVMLAVLLAASSLLTACSGGAGSGLTGGTWYLTSGTQTAPAWQWAVPPGEQASYTISFASDGNVNGKADCNQFTGTYKTSGTDGLTITPGASTMAYCGDGSLDTLYVHALSTTTNYKVASGELTLTLDGGGTLMFTSTSPTATAEPPASPATVPVGSPGEQGLTGWDWSLVAITEEVPAFQGVVPEEQQENYQIAFTDDGTFSAKADCNQVAGEYVTDDPAASSGPLTITPGPSTLAMCPEGSLGDLFVIGLSNAVSYEITADGLVITLGNGGTLQFK